MQWHGKLAYDDNRNLKIEVIKGKVDQSQSDVKYKVDGISGSTKTTKGVNNLVRFWLSQDGYGPFLDKLAKGELNG